MTHARPPRWRSSPLLLAVGLLTASTTATAFLDEDKPVKRPTRPQPVAAPQWPAGKVFKDCSDCPEMVVIPAGSFQMGSPSYEGHREDNEGPVHEVQLRSFAMSRSHVTRGQFAEFVRATGYQTGNGCRVWTGSQWEEQSQRNWRDPGFAQQDNHPVVCVNWNEAKAYAEWLSDKTGKRYTLPSEAQWEYAARAGSRTARWWGAEDAACVKANYNRCVGATTAVGSYEANGWGLRDALGNAWSWTQDCYHYNYQGAPQDGSAWMNNCSGETHRVLRGGGWIDTPQYVRSAYRGGNTPDIRINVNGFRLTRTLTP